MSQHRSLVLMGLLAALVGCSSGTEPDDTDTYGYPVGKVFFTHPPVALEGVVFFESMGALFTPFQEDHGGFIHLEIFEEDEHTIPVIAPADGQVTEIRTHEGSIDGVEHAVRLRVSTTIELLWGHVGRLSDRLAMEAGALGTSRIVRIPVAAGDTIGTVAPTALDFAVNDTTAKLSILHPEFYGPNPHAVPLEDYYREPLRSQIRALTAREEEPRTGLYGFDVAGTLSGLWYREGSDPRGPVFREDIAFHFGYHHLASHRTQVIDGLAYVQDSGSGAGPLWSFWVKGSPRWDGITPSSGQVKLEMFRSRPGLVSVGGWPNWALEDTSGLDDSTQTETILLVEMLDEDTIRLERFDAPGIAPRDVTGFTTNARTYHRNPIG